MRVETARAKINLTLHIGAPLRDAGHRFDGYHPLSSLVAFADIADEISAETCAQTQLTITGPFSDALKDEPDNLILRAHRLVLERDYVPPLHFRLIKNLPVAAGIGGGSANAAAALRLMQAWTDLPDDEWLDIAEKLGADVPVCFLSHTAHMSGIGEVIELVNGAGQIDAVLVNPGRAISTRDVFGALDRKDAGLHNLPSAAAGSLLARARAGGNTLEPISREIEPAISTVLNAIAATPECRLARMSGSGATCFGLYPSREQAQDAAQHLRRDHPDWWVVETRLGEAQ